MHGTMAIPTCLKTFCGFLLIKTKITGQTGTTEMSYFCHYSSWILRKSVKFVSSRLQKCVLNCWGLYWNFTLYDNVWSLKWCKNCSNIAVCLGDAAIQNCVLTVQSSCAHEWENFFFFFLCVLLHFYVICWMKHRK